MQYGLQIFRYGFCFICGKIPRNVMQQPLFCAIIGAGSIGGLIDSPQSPNTASHAHALFKNPHCKLVAIVEPNQKNQQDFLNRWGQVNVYLSLQELFEHESIELIFIASPTKFHASALQEALHVKSVKTILCEKPLVSNAKELEILKPLLLKSEKKILIHLMRTFDPSFVKLAQDIKNERWGKALYFQGVFTKGLLHNGIHMLGVLNHFFGKIESINSLHVRMLQDDISGDFKLTCKDASGLLSCMENLPYSAFELTLWFDNGKVEIKEGGSRIDTFIKKPSPLYEGYFTLEHEQTLPNTLQHYARNSLEFLLESDDLRAKQTLEEHILIHEKIFETINKEKQK